MTRSAALCCALTDKTVKFALVVSQIIEHLCTFCVNSSHIFTGVKAFADHVPHRCARRWISSSLFTFGLYWFSRLNHDKWFLAHWIKRTCNTNSEHAIRYAYANATSHEFPYLNFKIYFFLTWKCAWTFQKIKYTIKPLRVYRASGYLHAHAHPTRIKHTHTHSLTRMNYWLDENARE